MSVFRWAAPLLAWSGRRLTDDDFRCLADLLRPHVAPGGVLADLGGGTGHLGAGVARFLEARTVVVDPTAQMLLRVPAQPHVSVRLAAAEALPFPAGYFDAILCRDAFHHFRDQSAAAREISRVIRPAGGLLVREFEPSGATWAWAALERLLGEPAGFRASDDLRRLFATHGVEGSITPLRRGYAFLGSVRG